MILLLARVGLGIVATGALVTAGLGMRSPSVEPAKSTSIVMSSSIGSDSADHGARLVRLAESTTPFRASREVPTVRFGEVPLPPAAPVPPKPLLVLNGIVWGSVPAAVLEGIPGREGQVVLRLGESDGVFRVYRIERGTVVVTGLDTTWTLQVREPWK